MKTVMAILLGMASTVASAQAVDVGTVRWEKFPTVKAKPNSLDAALLSEKVEAILASGKCTLRGQSARRFDIDVPYAVMLTPDGKATRVLVSDMKCRPIEELAGAVVVGRSDAGDYLPTGENKPRWYTSALNFNVR